MLNAGRWLAGWGWLCCLTAAGCAAWMLLVVLPGCCGLGCWVRLVLLLACRTVCRWAAACCLLLRRKWAYRCAAFTAMPVLCAMQI